MRMGGRLDWGMAIALDTALIRIGLLLGRLVLNVKKNIVSRHCECAGVKRGVNK